MKLKCSILTFYSCIQRSLFRIIGTWITQIWWRRIVRNLNQEEMLGSSFSRSQAQRYFLIFIGKLNFNISEDPVVQFPKDRSRCQFPRHNVNPVHMTPSSVVGSWTPVNRSCRAVVGQRSLGITKWSETFIQVETVANIYFCLWTAYNKYLH